MAHIYEKAYDETLNGATPEALATMGIIVEYEPEEPPVDSLHCSTGFLRYRNPAGRIVCASHGLYGCGQWFLGTRVYPGKGRRTRPLRHIPVSVSWTDTAFLPQL